MTGGGQTYQQHISTAKQQGQTDTKSVLVLSVLGHFLGGNIFYD